MTSRACILSHRRVGGRQGGLNGGTGTQVRRFLVGLAHPGPGDRP